MFNLGSSKGMNEISFFENSNRPSAKGVFWHDLSLKILPERQASLPNRNGELIRMEYSTLAVAFFRTFRQEISCLFYRT